MRLIGDDLTAPTRAARYGGAGYRMQNGGSVEPVPRLSLFFLMPSGTTAPPVPVRRIYSSAK